MYRFTAETPTQKERDRSDPTGFAGHLQRDQRAAPDHRLGEAGLAPVLDLHDRVQLGYARQRDRRHAWRPDPPRGGDPREHQDAARVSGCHHGAPQPQRAEQHGGVRHRATLVQLEHPARRSDVTGQRRCHHAARRGRTEELQHRRRQQGGMTQPAAAGDGRSGALPPQGDDKYTAQLHNCGEMVH